MTLVKKLDFDAPLRLSSIHPTQDSQGTINTRDLNCGCGRIYYGCEHNGDYHTHCSQNGPKFKKKKKQLHNLLQNVLIIIKILFYNF